MRPTRCVIRGAASASRAANAEAIRMAAAESRHGCEMTDTLDPQTRADLIEARRVIAEQLDCLAYALRNRLLDPRKTDQHTATQQRLQRASAWLADQIGES